MLFCNQHPDSVQWITLNKMELFRDARFATIEKWIVELVQCSQDPFWLLDKFLLVAGARCTPRNRWQRIGWVLYHTFIYSQLSITLVCFISAVLFEEDSVTCIRTLLTFVTFSLCVVKINLLLKNSGGVLKLRALLQAPDFCSGDPDFDASVRKRFKRTSRMLIIIIALVIMIQQVLSWIPSEAIDIIFEIPAWVAWCWGDRVSLLIKNWYISFCLTIWCYKMYGCTVTVVILMLGFEAEQTILAHNFGQIHNDLQNLRQSYWDCELAKKQYWERLRSLVRVSFDQQQLLLGYVQAMCETTIQLRHVCPTGISRSYNRS